MLSAVIKPLGVNRPFLHHFLKLSCASSLLIEKGIILTGANLFVNRSAKTTPAPQKLQDVAVVSLSVNTTAPQFLQWYSWASSSENSLEIYSSSSNSIFSPWPQLGQDNFPESASKAISSPQLGHL